MAPPPRIQNRSISGSDANQLSQWSAAGRFTSVLEDPSTYPHFPDLRDNGARLADRARAYLAVNCAHCHQPLGEAPRDMDLRARIPISETRLIGVTPWFGSLGLENALRIYPRRKQSSVLWERMRRTDR